jgi:hypothetical protein
MAEVDDFKTLLRDLIFVLITMHFNTLFKICLYTLRYRDILEYCEGVVNNNKVGGGGWSLPYHVRQTPCGQVAGAPRAPSAEKKKKKMKKCLLFLVTE